MLEKLKTYKCKILIVVLIVLVFAGAVFGAYKLGQRQAAVRSLPVPTFIPTPSVEVIEGKTCGGIAGNLPERQCPPGYYCQLAGDYPDASGICVKE